ncbi:hypothetical protein G1C97_1929 [Bifidobacterium sp. DSM 109959]|uniref:Uncharacterized protein n=1 Tax=Bifidobacterium olomucense TaxID=2675324 RepID=A0A7Y0HX47_9BIFI|nr:hypothetical protein [Bifidobacterium sp. DSM 109959]
MRAQSRQGELVITPYERRRVGRKRRFGAARAAGHCGRALRDHWPACRILCSHESSKKPSKTLCAPACGITIAGIPPFPARPIPTVACDGAHKPRFRKGNANRAHAPEGAKRMPSVSRRLRETGQCSGTMPPAFPSRGTSSARPGPADAGRPATRMLSRGPAPGRGINTTLSPHNSKGRMRGKSHPALAVQ